MNKVITDGLVLAPPAFDGDLTQWSSGDGTPGSDTYAGSAYAAFVPADQDFGGCLEIYKTQSVQKLRWMGETPLLPGLYLRVTVRVKAISGDLPNVRIAGWAGGAGGAHVTGLVETGPSIALSTYGEVITVSAIIGTGARNGVDMVWGNGVLYGHFGIDLTGANGGTIRIDDIQIEDVTSVFFRQMMDWVDVRDYGAIGDGVTDDSAAFEAADAAAGGRQVLVPGGVYALNNHVTFENIVRFEGTVVMPVDKRLSLTKNFDLPSYIDAFGDEVAAFKKAIQALFNFSDHDSLDMKGRRIEVAGPIDIQAAVDNKTTFATRRVIRNGQFNVIAGAAWNPDIVTSQASYAVSSPTQLSNVVNVAQVPVGALLTGTGVGREIYVKSKNVGAGTLTLSQPLYDAEGTQVFTFTRFKYVLDFSGFGSLSKFVLSDVEIQCSGAASGIMLAPAGLIFHLRDSFITKPKHRGITSIGRGCQGMLIDRCQFLSSESTLRAQDRISIGLNVNANDVKLRDNRSELMGTFAVMNGTGHMILGNHWFQGDSESDGIRQAGLVLTKQNVKSTITGNYIDNCSIEWTNEHDAAPDFSSEYSFGALTIADNVFMAIDVAPWFKWITIKPYGPGHFIHGLNISGNTFKALVGNIQRAESVDTTFYDLDYGRSRNVIVQGNTFNGVDQVIANPVSLDFTVSSDAQTWTLDFGGYLPFGGWARKLSSVVAEGEIKGSGNSRMTAMPYAQLQQGAAKDQVKLQWPSPCRGKVHATARMDKPY